MNLSTPRSNCLVCSSACHGLCSTIFPLLLKSVHETLFTVDILQVHLAKPTSNCKTTPALLPLKKVVYVLFGHCGLLRHWTWSDRMTQKLSHHRLFSKASNRRKEHTSTGNDLALITNDREAWWWGVDCWKNSAAEVSHCYALQRDNILKRVKKGKRRGAHGKIHRTHRRITLLWQDRILKYTLLSVCLSVCVWERDIIYWSDDIHLQIKGQQKTSMTLWCRLGEQCYFSYVFSNETTGLTQSMSIK